MPELWLSPLSVLHITGIAATITAAPVMSFDGALETMLPPQTTGYRMANIGTPISFGRSRPLKDSLLDHFRPRTEIGRKLLALRRAYLVGGGKLLSWEAIDQEMRERRGGVAHE